MALVIWWMMVVDHSLHYPTDMFHLHVHEQTQPQGPTSLKRHSRLPGRAALSVLQHPFFLRVNEAYNCLKLGINTRLPVSSMTDKS